MNAEKLTSIHTHTHFKLQRAHFMFPTQFLCNWNFHAQRRIFQHSTSFISAKKFLQRFTSSCSDERRGTLSSLVWWDGEERWMERSNCHKKLDEKEKLYPVSWVRYLSVEKVVPVPVIEAFVMSGLEQAQQRIYVSIFPPISFPTKFLPPRHREVDEEGKRTHFSTQWGEEKKQFNWWFSHE